MIRLNVIKSTVDTIKNKREIIESLKGMKTKRKLDVKRTLIGP